MSEPAKAMVGVVIRKDGTVPFDDDVHPEVRAAILEHLEKEGHKVSDVKGTAHVKIKGWKPPKR